jgi:hypothetical protein
LPLANDPDDNELEHSRVAIYLRRPKDITKYHLEPVSVKSSGYFSSPEWISYSRAAAVVAK